jgi:hypothetical protein
MGRPAKKKVYVEEKARTKARLQAELEMHRKKPLEESTKEHIGKIIDNTKVLEIAEMVAVAGMTFVVHDVILGTEELLQKVGENYNTFSKAYTTLTGNPSAGQILAGFSIPTETLLALVGVNLTKDKTTAAPDMNLQVFMWLISFSLAYVIVKHAGQLLGLLDKGMGDILGLLLGV